MAESNKKIRYDSILRALMAVVRIEEGTGKEKVNIETKCWLMVTLHNPRPKQIIFLT